LGKYEYLNPRVQAGTYRIARGTTPTMLLMQIIEGRVAQYSITLVEGWNIYQVMDRLAQSNDLKHLLRGQNLAQVMTRIGHPGEHPEGRFFPETYDFPKGLSDIAFLQRAYKMMDERLAVEWEHRDPGLPYRNAYEALIMASIVEKETGQAIERPQIAGVFVRRLQKRMLLQTDPTVIYGLGPTFDGNLRRRDLLADNPYNTYRKQGLPPTPIAMPSAEAIHAALHPAPGKDLYFVARGDGSHYFSATLAEHNAAVIRFQLHGQARPFSSSQ
ncbi:MAG TPA: endolytic transglycosylase MltG, partial [Geothrix sp.]|nr:endolytic transglycosylase MltG [Geothrix sp.]